MSLTRELWQAIAPIYGSILQHPFIKGLTDGTLPRESFQFYAVHDALYLRELARALSIAAARAPQDDWIIMFNEHAAGALRVERALHESFFAEFGLKPADVTATATLPPVTAAGVAAVICVSLSTVKEPAGTPPKVTASTPVKPVPVMVTDVPPATGPWFGATVAMPGRDT